ncbi:MAG: cytochrome b/b6 domain-containing protein [Kangiellaceae bacterium]|nr:cytochrome b/b6 domain-containing protein [Kangiellaceae bacterium]MCW8999501.1 cytochrome b/b6 domain-containing protein [Kangiellaceae bacterium]
MKSFSWSYKLLHWLMAALIILMFFALQGFYPEMGDTDRIEMLIGHSSIGTIITVLILIRISKRFVLRHERPQHELASKQATVAKLLHYALYLLMVLVPLTGYLTANFHQLPVQLFGSISLNGNADTQTFAALRLVHSTSVKVLIGLVIMHIMAALIHKFILKDGVLSSMRPWFAKK